MPFFQGAQGVSIQNAQMNDVAGSQSNVHNNYGTVHHDQSKGSQNANTYNTYGSPGIINNTGNNAGSTVHGDMNNTFGSPTGYGTYVPPQHVPQSYHQNPPFYGSPAQPPPNQWQQNPQIPPFYGGPAQPPPNQWQQNPQSPPFAGYGSPAQPHQWQPNPQNPPFAGSGSPAQPNQWQPNPQNPPFAGYSHPTQSQPNPQSYHKSPPSYQHSASNVNSDEEAKVQQLSKFLEENAIFTNRERILEVLRSYKGNVDLAAAKLLKKSVGSK